MKQVTVGRTLLTLTSAWSAVGSYLFDWNDTHIYNPAWTAHAKFHNAQSMSMGVFVAARALWALWGPGQWDQKALNAAVIGASGYWLTQLLAIIYPGTALFDYARKPRNTFGNARREDDSAEPPSGTPPRWCGPQPVISLVALGVNAAAYGVERRRIRNRRSGPLGVVSGARTAGACE